MITRVSIEAAREAGRLAEYEAIAIEKTDTHLRIETGAYKALKQSLDAAAPAPEVKAPEPPSIVDWTQAAPAPKKIQRSSIAGKSAGGCGCGKAKRADGRK